MSLSAYVAGKLNERDRVRRVQEMIWDVGGRITFDWTAIEDVPDSKVEPYTGRSIAIKERAGVWDANLFVLCNSAQGMRGAHIETGMALSHSIPVVILDPGKRMSIFWYLDEVTLLTTEEFPSWLAKLTIDGITTLNGPRSGAVRLGHPGLRS